MKVKTVKYCAAEAGKNLRYNLTETICSSISVAITLLIMGILFLYFTIINQNSIEARDLTAVPNYIKFKIISRAIGAVSSVLIPIVSLCIVTSEMKIVVNSKRQEIELMRLVGAEDSFIYYIYVLQGIAAGFIGAFLGTVTLFLLSKGIETVKRIFLSDLMITIPSPEIVIYKMILPFFIFGIFISILGNVIALRKTLKKII